MQYYSFNLIFENSFLKMLHLFFRMSAKVRNVGCIFIDKNENEAKNTADELEIGTKARLIS